MRHWRVGIAVSDEPAADLEICRRGLERPALCLRIAERLNGLNVHARAPFSTSQAKQARVRHVPATIEQQEISRRHRELMFSSKRFQGTRG